jgi:hypothetical protein
MEVSNSSGVVTDYNVKGSGGGAAPIPSKDLPKGGPRKRAAAMKCGKLRPKTFCKVTPPPGQSWIVQFLQGEKVLAEEQVQDARALVVLVQESDGRFKIHISRSSTAAA